MSVQTFHPVGFVKMWVVKSISFPRVKVLALFLLLSLELISAGCLFETLQAQQRDFEEFQRITAYSRNEGLFFKNLYPSPSRFRLQTSTLSKGPFKEVNQMLVVIVSGEIMKARFSFEIPGYFFLGYFFIIWLKVEFTEDNWHFVLYGKVSDGFDIDIFLLQQVIVVKPSRDFSSSYKQVLYGGLSLVIVSFIWSSSSGNKTLQKTPNFSFLPLPKQRLLTLSSLGWKIFHSQSINHERKGIWLNMQICKDSDLSVNCQTCPIDITLITNMYLISMRSFHSLFTK
jgi:hypothetical protein